MPVASLQSIEQPIAAALELIKKDYAVLEALPCALTLLEQLAATAAPEGGASDKLVEAVSHVFDVALGRPANAASRPGEAHASAREWVQRCCKIAGGRANLVAQQLVMPCLPSELRAKVATALQSIWRGRQARSLAARLLLRS